jgi:hypothetical protein
MTLITEEYTALNKKMHAEKKHYGTTSPKWAGQVRELYTTMQADSLLDYGCGKGHLAMQLPFPVREYDPAITGKDATPEPAALVVCTDVLEHVELECLGAVLDDLQRVTQQVLFLTVATRPANKTLPDGRNAHLIVESASWWLPQLMSRFELRNFTNVDSEFMAVFEAQRRA